jgi:L-iditol 2-dehydrogenase
MRQLGIRVKALVLYGQGDLRFVSDWAVPEVKEGWLLVKTRYSGICGSDLPRMMQTGSYHYPLICGHEFSGAVDTPGSSSFSKGERVAVLPLIPCDSCEMCLSDEPFHCTQYGFLGSRQDGGFAEYCLVPEKNVFVLPAGTAFEIGALIEPLLVALHAVRRSGPGIRNRVLIIGAGTIGNLIAQWLNILGDHEVFITDIRAQSLELAKQCGINTLNAAGREVLTNGPYGVIFDAAGSYKALCSALQNIDHMGNVIVIGRETKDYVIDKTLFESFMRKEAKLFGCWGYKIRGEEEFLREILRKNLINYRPLITHRFPLEGGAKAIQRMWERSFFYGKVILESRE